MLRWVVQATLHAHYSEHFLPASPSSTGYAPLVRTVRIAAIDIGTNSVHMIVVQVRPDHSFEIVDREKEMVRLGAGSAGVP